MGYRLKKSEEEFTITDGPLAGMNYLQEVEYPTLPKGYESRFEPVPKPKAVSSKPMPKSTPKTSGSGKIDTAKETGADAAPKPSKTEKDNDK